MSGPSPKDPTTRARRNKTSTHTLLSAIDPDDVEIPDLPGTAAGGLGWFAETEEWWVEVWSSPMSAEFTDSDYYGIVALAQLWNARELAFAEGRIGMALELTKEIRLQQPKYGLTPDDRRRLQWTIDQGEKAAAQSDARRRDEEARNQAPLPPDEEAPDPRAQLRLVSSNG